MYFSDYRDGFVEEGSTGQENESGHEGTEGLGAFRRSVTSLCCADCGKYDPCAK